MRRRRLKRLCQRLCELQQQKRAHSHFPGHAVKSERWELAICFSTFQRPAL
jgi:hypothetical protein